MKCPDCNFRLKKLYHRPVDKDNKRTFKSVEAFICSSCDEIFWLKKPKRVVLK